jgi:hypothetical protein
VIGPKWHGCVRLWIVRIVRTSSIRTAERAVPRMRCMVVSAGECQIVGIPEYCEIGASGERTGVETRETSRVIAPIDSVLTNAVRLAVAWDLAGETDVDPVYPD